MITLYSGTPGSGKSLHLASKLYHWIQDNRPVICINFEVNLDNIKGAARNKHVYFMDGETTSPDDLIRLGQAYSQERGRVKEDSFLVVWDEAQRQFNTRDWGQKNRLDWLKFFTLHRHWGFQIIMVAQFDRMLDRQIRALFEYEYIHRKMSNFGAQGKIIALLCGGELFVAVKRWYPLKERLGVEYFRKSKKYLRIYDTFALLDVRAASAGEDGEKGDPADLTEDARPTG